MMEHTMEERNKTICTHFKLINWYGFTNTLILPIGDATYITADNAAGKSAMMDAIRYCLHGEHSFNSASETGKKRTIEGYVRGLLNPERETYMRPVETYPDVYCHIAVQINNINEGNFVIDTLIHARNSETTTYRYIILNKTIAEIESVLIDENGYPASKRVMDSKFGPPADIEDVFASLGLRYNRDQIRNFNDLHRKIVSYKPTPHISDFIKSCVLDDKKVKLDRLFERKNKLTDINATYSKLICETEAIKQIQDIQKNIETRQNRLRQDEMLRTYLSIQHYKMECEESGKIIAAQESIVKNREDDKRRYEDEQGRMQDKINMAKAQQSIGGANEAIKKIEDEIAATKKEILTEETKVQKIVEYEESVKALYKNHNIVSKYEDEATIKRLTDKTLPPEIKEQAANDFKAFVNRLIEQLYTQKCELEKVMQQKREQKNEADRKIVDYTKNKVNYDQIGEAKSICELANAECRKAGIKGQVRLAFEYVSSIKDETWRNALECILGKSRYTIIPDVNCFDVALKVLNREKSVNAHLCNTPLLMQRKFNVVDDSAACLLNVAEPVARQFFDYKLGQIHAVALDEVKEYENSISREGLVSTGMDMYYLDYKRIRTYYLGQESITRNLELCRQSSQELECELKDLREKMQKTLDEYNALDRWRSCYAYVLDFKALTDLDRLQNSYDKLIEEMKRLIEAKKNDAVFMALQNTIDESHKRLQALKNMIHEAKSDVEAAEKEKIYQTGRKEQAERKLEQEKRILQQMENEDSLIYATMLNLYNRRVAEAKRPEDDKLEDTTISRYGDEINNYKKTNEQNMMQFGNQYKATRTLPEVDYDETLRNIEGRRRLIDQEENPRVQAEIRRLEEEYEIAFKKEFVLQTYHNCRQGKDDILKLNRRLKSLGFAKLLFQFEVKEVSDGDYGIILEYGKYLYDQNTAYGTNFDSNQMFLDLPGQNYTTERGRELEREISGVMEKLLATKDESRIAELSDYRNYLIYKIKCTDPIKGEIDFEKSIASYGSGAEIQIPHTLVLISSLITMYANNPNSLRIMYMDEPYNRMSAPNIKPMANFIKQQHIQCIYCAPDKMDSLGECSNVVLGIQKDLTDGAVSIAFVHKHEEA